LEARGDDLRGHPLRGEAHKVDPGFVEAGDASCLPVGSAGSYFGGLFGDLAVAEQSGQGMAGPSGGAVRERAAAKKKMVYEGFEVGTRVSLVGLEARRDLNFRMGCVVNPGRQTVTQGRIPVRVDAVILGGVEVHSSE